MIGLVCVIIAFAFAVVETVKTKGQSLLCWAVVLLAFAMLLPLLRTLRGG